MNDGAHVRFINPEPERERAHEDALFTGHPRFLIAAAGIIIHLPVIRHHRMPLAFQGDRGCFHRFDGRRIHDHVAFGVPFEGGGYAAILLPCSTFMDDIFQVRR